MRNLAASLVLASTTIAAVPLWYAREWAQRALFQQRIDNLHKCVEECAEKVRRQRAN